MKFQKYFYVILLTLSCAALIYYIPKLLSKGSRAVKQLPQTSIEVARHIINLGDVPQDIPAAAVFTIKNTGTTNLVISSVIPDCHCTGAEWDKKPIAPGQTTYIKTAYDSHAPGIFQKLVKVSANIPDSLLVLTIRGNVVAN